MLLHLTRPGVRAGYGLATPDALFVLLDCQEFGGSPPEEIYEALLTELVAQAGDAGLEIGTINRYDTYWSLDRVLNGLYRQGASVVVLLDEFELLAANAHLTPYFFARLRGLTTKYGLAYLTASQHPLFAISADEQILSSPFFNIFVTLPLGLYREDEARTLISARLEGTGVAFPEPLCEHLLKLVGPHPFFLHVAGYHAFNACQEHFLNHADGYAALDEAIEVEVDSHLSYLWQNLSSDDQYTLATLSGPIDSLRLLEQQCLIEPEDGEYRYPNTILRRYVRRQQVEGLVQGGPFVIDLQRHAVRARGREMNLTTSQFDLLVCLTRQAGQVVHSDKLEIAVWGEVLVDDPDRLKTLIKRLRRAVEPYDNWIVSERGVGYALRPPG